MIEFTAMFWLEFAASLMVAVAARVGFALALRRKDGESDQDATPDGQDATTTGAADSRGSGVLDFLREAVRLAEERIKAQDDHARALERKAILLGALCVFTVAFLVTGDFGASGAFPVKAAAIVLLVASAAFCAQTVDFLNYGRRGLYAPGAIPEYLQTPRPADLKRLHLVVLRSYYTSIIDNEKANDNKAVVLLRARRWWINGSALALGTLAGNSAPIEWAACRLIG